MTGDTVIGVPIGGSDPRPLTPEERIHFIAHIRSRRGKLLNRDGRNSKTFHEAFRWANNLRVFETLLQDMHVPGNSISCRVEDLAAYLERKHIDLEAEEIVEEEEEFPAGN